MANGWRVSLFWNTSAYGPSEVWHWLSEAGMGQAGLAAVAFVQQRLKLVANGYHLTGIRLSKEGQPRRAFLMLPGGSYNLEGGAVTFPAPGAPAFPVASLLPIESLLVRVQGTNNNGQATRNWYLVGAPATIGGFDDNNGIVGFNPAAQPNWLPALIGDNGNPPVGGLLQYMKANQWGFLGQSQAAAFTPVPILAVVNAVAPSGLLGIVTPNNAPNVAQADKVHVERLTTVQRGLPSANREWGVASVSQDSPKAGQQTIFLAGSAYLLASNFKQPVGTSTVRKVGLDEYNVSGMNVIKTVSRKRGSGGLRPRGRRLTHQ